MNELKPCPKCGGKGDEKIGYGYYLFVCGINTGVGLGHIVVCEKCKHQTQAHYDSRGAFDEWNRRTDNG